MSAADSGYRLYYEEWGEGKPLVLLHGNGEDHHYFQNQIDCFRKKYRVIAVDTRGHGKSPRGNAPFTLKQFAKDLRELLERLHLSRVMLLGFSDGANIAMIFALRYPEQVDKLILNGGNFRPSGVRLRYQIPIVLGYAGAKLAADLGLGEKFRNRAELLGLMVKEPRIRPGDLGKLSMSVLVIAGNRDMIRTSHTRRIHDSIPGSRLCILKGSHFIAAENSGEFNRAVQEFLDR